MLSRLCGDEKRVKENYESPESKNRDSLGNAAQRRYLDARAVIVDFTLGPRRYYPEPDGPAKGASRCEERLGAHDSRLDCGLPAPLCAMPRRNQHPDAASKKEKRNQGNNVAHEPRFKPGDDRRRRAMGQVAVDRQGGRCNRRCGEGCDAVRQQGLRKSRENNEEESCLK